MSDHNATTAEEGPVWPWALGLMLVGLIAFAIATAIHGQQAALLDDEPPTGRLEAEPVIDGRGVGEGDVVRISFSDISVEHAIAA